MPVEFTLSIRQKEPEGKGGFQALRDSLIKGMNARLVLGDEAQSQERQGQLLNILKEHLNQRETTSNGE